MFSQKLACVPLKTDPSIRRSHLSPDKLLSRPAGDNVKIVGDIFSYTAKKYGDRTACFYRDIVDVVEETKMVPKSSGEGQEEKVWKFWTLSPPKPVTYKQLDIFCQHITSGLVHLGFTDPSQSISERPRAAIHAETCLNWQLIAQSYARLGHVFTTAYTTLGEDGLFKSLADPDVQMVFCGGPQLELVGRVVGRAEKVRFVVYDGEQRVDKGIVETIRSILEPRRGRILSMSELQALGSSKPLNASDFGPRPTEDDLFCIMYTSGSTGPPKGALLSNKNMIASLAGSSGLWAPYWNPKNDLLLAFLPLAHILEQFLEYSFYLFGVPIGYAMAKTLTDASVRNCQGDFTAYRPTLIGGVPGIFEGIRKGMMQKIQEAGPVVGTVFNLAVKGKQTLPWPLTAAIDKTLFAKVKAATGGRLRMAVCGGGALSHSTQLFLSTVMAPVMQGYGLTETCGMTAITTQAFWQIGNVGVLGPSTELKLVDQPALGYVSSSSPPQGEIWLRGPNVFQGYFKEPELTRESLTDDGWFKSGDIGQWEANGTLTIIDRVKNLCKMQNGEYLALDRVESMYKACDVVMMLCICAPSNADRPIAVVYPHEGNLRLYLKAANLPSNGTPEQWVSDPTIKGIILQQMIATAKKNGLARHETIKDIVMTTQEWSPDNGMLTPAMKMARPVIAKRYEKEISTALGPA
ncbi:MAG: long-chain fatty acid-CoA ligase [Tremellales sp. Tagirdzhanova-0007]|nr:MAG: long-chain fatty acid-CoA ligase [Tremellales sp. Tagirdzhanova-0007]